MGYLARSEGGSGGDDFARVQNGRLARLRGVEEQTP
jgi:hypothetical protein